MDIAVWPTATFHEGCPNDGMWKSLNQLADRSAATCHIFCVSRTVLPEGQPFYHCHACGEPLADHKKRTSSLVPAGKVYVIDERTVRV
jgi:hypothetical protein